MDKSAITTDDSRIKRVLKRYLKGEEFSDATLELTGIYFEELQSRCRCSAKDFTSPRELYGYGLVYFTNRTDMSFDGGKYDYFVHTYAKREVCSPDRVPPKELNLPCEDGPPTKIPLANGLRWVSTRPKEGRENYVGIEDEN